MVRNFIFATNGTANVLLKHYILRGFSERAAELLSSWLMLDQLFFTGALLILAWSASADIYEAAKVDAPVLGDLHRDHAAPGQRRWWALRSGTPTCSTTIFRRS